MNGDTFSIKAPKECSKKFAATFKGKFLTIGLTPRGSCNRTLLRRVRRRFFKGSAFLEGFLEGTL